MQQRLVLRALCIATSLVAIIVGISSRKISSIPPAPTIGNFVFIALGPYDATLIVTTH